MAGCVDLSDIFTIDAGSNLSRVLSTIGGNNYILSNLYHVSVAL